MTMPKALSTTLLALETSVIEYYLAMGKGEMRVWAYEASPRREGIISNDEIENAFVNV